MKRECKKCHGNTGMKGRYPPADGLCPACRTAKVSKKAPKASKKPAEQPKPPVDEGQQDVDTNQDDPDDQD